MSFQARPILTRSSLAALLAGLVGCGEEITIVPDAPLVAEREATEAECPNGGLVLETGLDANQNGQLEPSEVRDAAPVCNGSQGPTGPDGPDGALTLVVRTDEPPGDNCAQGGERVDVGIDDDGDGTLAAGEIDATTYVCAGLPGADAPRLLTETSTTVEDVCPEGGGTRLSAGLDDDGDGTLDEEEVDVVEVVCAGESGLAQILVVDVVGPGADCPAGGQRIRSGLDANGDGLLQTAEETDVSFICAPLTVLTEVSALVAGDPDCPAGGQRIDVGTDANGDGVLDASEVTSTSFACRGPDGARVLTRRDPEPAGANCPNGGERIAVGLDANGNLVLDAAEEVTVSYTCDGAAGSPGTGGGAVRVSAEPPGPNCAAGGLRVETGADADGDGVLADGEVDQISYVCDAAVANVLADVVPEPPGARCPNGGTRLDVGLDVDLDGTLDPTEVTSTSFICSNRADVPFGITTSELPLAVPNTPYSITIEAAGGVGGGFTWSVVGGSLPAGFTLDPVGTPGTTLSGTPTGSGTFAFVVQVTDLIGNTATQAFSLEVARPLAFETRSVPAFAPGVAYSTTLTASGGRAPYAFAVVGSSLPAGLALSSAGVLSGTPTTKFGNRFIVEVTDADGDTARGAFSLRGPREYFAYCGDVLTDGVFDVILGRITPAGTSTLTITPRVGGTTIDVSCFDVALSPASDRIAIVGDAGTGSDELFVVDFSAFPTVTSTRVNAPLASSDNDITDILWSPDGRYLAYFGDVDVNLDNELYVADVSDLSAVTTTQVNGPLASGGDVFTGYAFSPDSRRIVYRADERTDGQNEVFAFDLTSSTNLGPVNGPLATTSDDVDDGFEISADSRYVLYAAEQNVADVMELFVTRIDGVALGTPVRVNPPLVDGGDIGETTFPADDDYGFSPTGEYIAYVADQDTDLVGQAYLVATDNPGTSQLLSPVGQSSPLDVFDLQWDALGRRVLLRGDLTTNAENELYAADIFNPGADPVRVNGDLVSGGDVDTLYGFAPDNSFVFYEADQDVSTQEEPYIVFTDALGTAGSSVRLLAGGFSDFVSTFVVAADGSAVVAVLDTSSSTTDYEAFASQITGGVASPAVRVNAPFTGTNQDVSTSQIVSVADRFLLYISDENVNDDSEAFLVEASTGAKTSLTSPLPAGGDASTVMAQEF